MSSGTLRRPRHDPWPAPSQPARRPRHRAAAGALTAATRLPVAAVALSASLGLLVVAGAYAGGRLGAPASPWPDRAYWLGQALIVVPAALKIISTEAVTESAAAAVIMILGIVEYLVKVCYSPLAFSYVDELEHWRSTLNLLHTGRLFGVNYLLPISPQYPGLEEVTAALTSVTGLPVFVAGLIVAGAAHVLFIGAVYLVFRHVAGSHRAAGLAMLVYIGNPSLAAFDSMFAYQTLAMTFLALAVLATWHATTRGQPGSRAGWTAVAVLAILATVVTHHVTSYILVAVLALIALAGLITGNRGMARRAGALALISAAAAGGWLALAAPQTLSYLAPVTQELIGSVRSLVHAGHSSAPPTSRGPLGDIALAGLATLITSVLVAVGCWQVWRRHRRQPWIVAMAIGSLSWYAIVAVRLVAADGSELAGRASTFVFVPAGFIAALALAHLASTRRRWQAPVIAAMTAGVLVLLFDGLANGWPTYWERLPGPYQVAGFERSVEPENIAAAQWALAKLGPGNRFAADFGSYPVLGSYGDQNPVLNDSYLYTAPRLTRSAALGVQAEAISYVLADWRMTRALPASGQYFPGVDPGAGRYTRPLPTTDLTKFNHIRGVGRLYDSGDIIIYDLERSRYYAP